MTEASPVVTHRYKDCDKHESVGSPLPNTEVKIVDVERGTDLPAGRVGELCVRGPQVCKRII